MTCPNLCLCSNSEANKIRYTRATIEMKRKKRICAKKISKSEATICSRSGPHNKGQSPLNSRSNQNVPCSVPQAPVHVSCRPLLHLFGMHSDSLACAYAEYDKNRRVSERCKVYDANGIITSSPECSKHV